VIPPVLAKWISPLMLSGSCWTWCSSHSARSRAVTWSVALPRANASLMWRWYRAMSRTGLGSETGPDETLGRLAPACPRVSRALGSDWMVPRIFFHAYQFQAEVAKSVQDAVKVGLIMDLADEGALFVARIRWQTPRMRTQGVR